MLRGRWAWLLLLAFRPRTARPTLTGLSPDMLLPTFQYNAGLAPRDRFVHRVRRSSSRGVATVVGDVFVQELAGPLTPTGTSVPALAARSVLAAVRRPQQPPVASLCSCGIQDLVWAIIMLMRCWQQQQQQLLLLLLLRLSLPGPCCRCCTSSLLPHHCVCPSVLLRLFLPKSHSAASCCSSTG
jgi:hypothetical protein